MLAESAIPYVTDEMISYVIRVLICIHSYIFIMGVSNLQDSKQLLAMRDDPDNKIHDSDVRKLIAESYTPLTIESRRQKLKGYMSLVVAILGIVLICLFFGENNSVFVGFAFASFAFTALTIHAVILSVMWLIDISRHKDQPDESKQEYNKTMRALAQKHLAKTLPLAIAGIIVSGYLLLHVFPA